MRRALKPSESAIIAAPQRESAHSFTASSPSPSVVASLFAAAGKIPDHHHGARHSICCGAGGDGGVGGWRVEGVEAVNIVNGNCGLSVSLLVTWCGEDTFSPPDRNNNDRCCLFN